MDKVVTYAFLSVIKEKSGNITSLLSIFQELVEGLLSSYAKQKKGGYVIDLQREFKATYHIDIPLPTLKTIINNIITRDKSILTTYSDDSFTTNQFPEKDFSILVQKQENDIGEFYNLYDRYLYIRGLNPKDYDLLEFFDQNKRYIVKCLSGSLDTEENHQVQAQFIQKLLQHKQYYELINRIFLGSIISSYIELEIDDSTKHNKVLLLDTNFIVSLLNLHSEEAYENCKMLIEIANRLKYKIEIMPFTIDETSALLNRIATNLNNNTYFQSLDKDSIYHGCFRNNINASTLTFISNKFADKLQQQYGILITDGMTNNAMIAEARQSQYYKSQKRRQHNPEGALHDATALYYTQKLRKGSPASFKDINAWFVTDTRGFHENLNTSHQNVSLMIRAEELLNILWLSHPSYDSTNYIQTTISRLLSAKLSTVPNAKLLKALDKKIDVVKDYPVNAKDCIQIAEVIGSIENQKLKLILEKNTQEGIVNELKRLSKLADEKEAEKQQEDKEFLLLIQEDMKKNMEKEKAILEKIKNEEIAEISVDVRNESANKEITLLDELIKRDREELESIENRVLLQISIQAEKFVRNLFIVLGIISFILFIFLSCIIKKYWTSVEPVLYLLSFLPLFISYFSIAIFSKKISFTEIRKSLKLLKENKLKNKNLSQIFRTELLKKRISENEYKIKTTQDKIVFY